MSANLNRLSAAVAVSIIVGVGSTLLIRPSRSAGGAVPVQVTNSTTSPAETQDVDNPAQQPIQFLAQPDTFGTSSSDAVTNITVPAHKRLVIEYISAALGTGTGAVTVETISGGNLAAYYLIENSSTHTHEFLPTRIYADPGSNVQVAVHSNNGARVYADVELSGHYVNLP